MQSANDVAAVSQPEGRSLDLASDPPVLRPYPRPRPTLACEDVMCTKVPFVSVGVLTTDLATRSGPRHILSFTLLRCPAAGVGPEDQGGGDREGARVLLREAAGHRGAVPTAGAGGPQGEHSAVYARICVLLLIGGRSLGQRTWNCTLKGVWWGHLPGRSTFAASVTGSMCLSILCCHNTWRSFCTHS